MRPLRILNILYMAAWLAIGTLCSGQQQVRLLRLPKLSKSADALPRIAHPTRAQAKINRELALFDAKARTDVISCRGLSEAGYGMSYTRSIFITSRGPLLMSVDVTEQFDCGGVHSYFQDFALTYDLHTGEQMSWAASLTKGEAVDVLMFPVLVTPVQIDSVQSLRLQRLYVAGLKDQGDCSTEVIVDPIGEEPRSFYLSPTPKKAGLSVSPANLPSSVAQCYITVVLGKDAMQELGLSEALQKELLSAQ